MEKSEQIKDILMNSMQDFPMVIKLKNGSIIYPTSENKLSFLTQIHRNGENEFYNPYTDTYYYRISIEKEDTILELYVDINIYKKTIGSLEIDETTGILVKKRLFEELKNYFIIAQEKEEDFSLALFDIDLFKKVNDNYSHLAGDITLRHFCDTIKQNVRSRFKLVQGYPFRDKDIVGRFGGEEIIMLLKNISYDDSFSKIESIRNQVADMTTYYEDSTIKITCSVGIAHVTGATIHRMQKSELLEDSFMSSIIEVADEQLILAKNSGRNQSHIKVYTK